MANGVRTDNVCSEGREDRESGMAATLQASHSLHIHEGSLQMYTSPLNTLWQMLHVSRSVAHRAPEARIKGWW